jgi:hypothetical protein
MKAEAVAGFAVQQEAHAGEHSDRIEAGRSRRIGQRMASRLQGPPDRASQLEGVFSCEFAEEGRQLRERLPARFLIKTH